MIKDHLIYASSVAMEREIVGRARCACGGMWRVTRRDRRLVQQQAVDEVHAECTRCGESTWFYFDVWGMCSKC